MWLLLEFQYQPNGKENIVRSLIRKEFQTRSQAARDLLRDMRDLAARLEATAELEALGELWLHPDERAGLFGAAVHLVGVLGPKPAAPLSALRRPDGQT